MPPALLYNRSSRTRIRFTGPKAVETINGLVTNDLMTLQPGQGCYACILTAKSKILADVRIFKISAEELLLDAEATCGAALPDFFRKYVNPRLAKFEDISQTTGMLTLGIDSRDGDRMTDDPLAGSGSEADQTLSATLTQLSGLFPETATPYNHISTELFGIPVSVITTPELGTAAFDILADADQISALSTAFTSFQNVIQSSDESWERRRIEIGWPKWGADMDDNTFPQEANMVELNAISFTKGCYIGQETVARIHYRGHVNKFLRVVEIEPEAESNKLPIALLSHEGKDVGTITSAAGKVGIAMIRREVEAGTVLSGTSSIDKDSTYKVTVIKTAQGAA